MVWFKVDDQLAFHRKAVLAGNAAMGLWVRAGSWSAGAEQDGHVPDEIVTALGGTPAQIKKLTVTGLWARDGDGYQFHDWHIFQPMAQDIQLVREKESESGVKGNHKKWHVKRGIINPDCILCQGLS